MSEGVSHFLPTTHEEMQCFGWKGLDVILITGDTYIDSPSIGVAVIGRILLDAGYRVGIIAQPDIYSGRDIMRLGEPELFWGVTSGSMDSMVANYTASGRRRKSDDMTPGGKNTRRPDRAAIVYANLIRRYFKNTSPIVLGGLEASLRRISHYDAWSDSIRRSILIDAKADILVYGLAEKTILALAEYIHLKKDVRSIRGICYIHRAKPDENTNFKKGDIQLPDHEMVCHDHDAFIRMFNLFYHNMDPYTAGRLYQKQDTRYVVQNPPPFPLSVKTLDRIHEFSYLRDVHPFYKKDGFVPALETIRFSLTTHRGCYGECRFCSIAVHQGRHIISRSEDSLVREAERFLSHSEFKGIISDVGGPTANMYGNRCVRKDKKGACPGKSCVFPGICSQLSVDHNRQIQLLRRLRSLKGIRKIFIGSGIRYDLILHDKNSGETYLTEILKHHISGQLKIAPEHTEDHILAMMGKPGHRHLKDFLALFNRLKRKCSHKIFLTYYFMAAHPGCTMADMENLRKFAIQKLKVLPEQSQIFTPTPSTYSTLMYYTEKDPFSGENIFVEKRTKQRARQKQALGKKR